eukprot:TRINITY_DN6394_c0_g2_i8.p1 TRINITY_DN6394_c0_g2~~TRINITY_DN6394_c0_g2_i8.p1  ORF type:complete len:673 (+),score=166.95 TRINITY_DN6394_c0_g2_i8:91-2109(+)
MADFSSFGEERFDPREWINSALKGCADGQHQQQVSTMVMKLQVLTQEMTQGLEESSLQVVQNLPRALRYIDRLATDANHLRKFMNGILESLAKVEKDTESTVGFISEIDQVKGRMEVCLKVLNEAQMVVSQSDKLKESFSTSDFEEIANRLSSMGRSLDVLSGIPEFSSKRQELREMEENLAKAIVETLTRVFEMRDKEKARSALRILTKINRSKLFYDHYFDLQVRATSALWSTSISAKDKDPLSFVSWIPRFYDEVLSLVKEQSSWLSDILTDYTSVLARMVHKIFVPQIESFRERLKAVSTATSDSLTDLLSCYGATNSFQRNLEALLQGATPESLALVNKVVYEPYYALQNQYQILEMKRMIVELSELKLTSPLTSVHVTLSMIEDSIPRVFLITEAALERCRVFTCGREAVGFCLALTGFADNYSKQLIAIITQLRSLLGIDSEKPRDDAGLVDNSIKLLQISSTLHQRMNELRYFVKSQMMDMRASLISFGESGSKTILLEPLYLASDPEKLAKLISFYEDLDNESQPLLSGLMNSIRQFVETCEKFVYDVTFAPVKQKLKSFSKMECWAAEPPEQPEGVYMPTFSPDPSTAITEVGGFLFTFLQEIEAFSFEGFLSIASKTYQLTGLGEAKVKLGCLQKSAIDSDEDQEAEAFTTKWLSVRCSLI